MLGLLKIVTVMSLALRYRRVMPLKKAHFVMLATLGPVVNISWNKDV